MVSQVGRLLGLIILTVELNRIGIKRLELFGTLSIGLAALGTSFINHRRDGTLTNM
jgi:hypothetical protein